MSLADLLPYATSLGMAFVLVGFVLMIWREGAAHRFSTMAFACFLVGIAITGWTIFAQHNEPPTPVSALQAETDARTAVHIRDCLQALKRAYVDEVQRLGTDCKIDALGWPDPKCVQKTTAGQSLLGKLSSESAFCYRTPKK